MTLIDTLIAIEKRARMNGSLRLVLGRQYPIPENELREWLKAQAALGVKMARKSIGARERRTGRVYREFAI